MGSFRISSCFSAVSTFMKPKSWVVTSQYWSLRSMSSMAFSLMMMNRERVMPKTVLMRSSMALTVCLSRSSMMRMTELSRSKSGRRQPLFSAMNWSIERFSILYLIFSNILGQSEELILQK